MKLKEVSQQELIDFVNAYPKRLDRDVCRTFEPPLLTYNDFSDGKIWPESIVASVVLNEDMKGFPGYDGEKNVYRIMDK